MGDLDGDGFDDIRTSASFTGMLLSLPCVFLGPVTGVVGISEADYVLGYGAPASVGLSYQEGTTGDVDGDGHADIWLDVEDAEGQKPALLYLGPIDGDRTYDEADAIVTTGDSVSGGRVAAAPDTNGDGLTELLAGTALFTSVPSGDTVTADADAELLFDLTAEYGLDVDTAGDFNGDGYGDVLIADDNFSDVQLRAGALWILPGPLSGKVGTADAALRLDGELAESRAGVWMGGGGDLDDDGYSDVLTTSDGPELRFVHVVRGTTDTGTRDLASADTVVRSDASSSRVYWVDFAGDIDADGFTDAGFGAPYATQGLRFESGALFLASGGVP